LFLHFKNLGEVVVHVHPETAVGETGHARYEQSNTGHDSELH
jgi:hypothetical protein